MIEKNRFWLNDNWKLIIGFSNLKISFIFNNRSFYGKVEVKDL